LLIFFHQKRRKNNNRKSRKAAQNTFLQKAGHKMLVKLTPRVNFFNILCARFLYESYLNSFSLITFGFVIFGAKILYKKHPHKMLMKLTVGLPFILTTFYREERKYWVKK